MSNKKLETKQLDEIYIKIFGNSTAIIEPIEDLKNYFYQMGKEIAKNILEEFPKCFNLSEETKNFTFNEDGYMDNGLSYFYAYCQSDFDKNDDIKKRIELVYLKTERADIFPDPDFIFELAEDALFKAYDEAWSIHEEVLLKNNDVSLSNTLA